MSDYQLGQALKNNPYIYILCKKGVQYFVSCTEVFSTYFVLCTEVFSTLHCGQGCSVCFAVYRGVQYFGLFTGVQYCLLGTGCVQYIVCIRCFALWCVQKVFSLCLMYSVQHFVSCTWSVILCFVAAVHEMFCFVLCTGNVQPLCTGCSAFCVRYMICSIICIL